MEIKKIKCKSGNEYSIVNEYWETSSSWGHKSTLLHSNNYEVATNKVRYINRTWEWYRYQTCMLGLVHSVIEKEQTLYITRYKENNGINRFKKGQKDEVLKEWENTEYAKDLLEIIDRIRNKNFD